jgi:hypothetical protein
MRPRRRTHIPLAAHVERGRAGDEPYRGARDGQIRLRLLLGARHSQAGGLAPVIAVRGGAQDPHLAPSPDDRQRVTPDCRQGLDTRSDPEPLRASAKRSSEAPSAGKPSPRRTRGAGMPLHVRPPSRVRSTEVHGAAAQGAVPRTQPMVGETNVTD